MSAVFAGNVHWTDESAKCRISQLKLTQTLTSKPRYFLRPLCTADGLAVGQLLLQILWVNTLASLVEEARGNLNPFVFLRPAMKLVEQSILP